MIEQKNKLVIQVLYVKNKGRLRARESWSLRLRVEERDTGTGVKSST